MEKLLPPLIEGTLPAFTQNQEGIIEMIIPFSMNKAVRFNEVNGIQIKIKTVQSSTLLESIMTKQFSENQAVFSFSASDQLSKFRLGQFYKIQIAYIDRSNQIGYYSNVGVIKFTSMPKVEILNFETAQINTHRYKYTGHYQQLDDLSEKVYSYNFELTDTNGQIVETTGWKLHNTSDDFSYEESFDEYEISQDFPEKDSFYLSYRVRTVNGLEISSPLYRLKQKVSIDSDIILNIIPELNYDNGYIDIHFQNANNNFNQGSFSLSRSTATGNFLDWKPLFNFSIFGDSIEKQVYRDYLIEQGQTYKYSLQQYNDTGLYSNRILSKTIMADFEDSFLYDGSVQFRIKYNPKVSSFKNNIAETKTDTLGSQYPFIFRNGKILYKEFPISGLISCLSDNENLFSSLSINDTNLSSYNITTERIFKLQLLEWLNNGSPKIFKSPAEGNYIVQLMNTSLTPNDTLGRMLHSFSCTAYEVADYSYENLTKYNFISLKNEKKESLCWATIPLAEEQDGMIVYQRGILDLTSTPLYAIKFTNMTPGDKFSLWPTGTNELLDIVIGATGTYETERGIPFNAIILPESAQYTGEITYSFFATQKDSFSDIKEVGVFEVPAQQFIGKHDIVKEIEYIEIDGKYQKNPKINLMSVYYLTATKRDVQKIYPQVTGTYSLDTMNFIPFNEDEYKFSIFTEHPTDYEDQFQFELNGETIDLKDTKYFELKDIGKITSCSSKDGVIIECGFQVRNISYLIEFDSQYPALVQARERYEKMVRYFDILIQAYSGTTEQDTQLDMARLAIKEHYQEYIKQLIIAQAQEEANNT